VLTDLETVRWLGPEIALVLAATIVAVGGAFRAAPRFWLAFTLAAYGLAATLLLVGEPSLASLGGEPLFTGPLVVDPLGKVFRLLAIAGGTLLALTLFRSGKQPLQTEILCLTVFTMVGVMITSRANELVMLMLGLELVSIPTYALLFIGRRGRTAGESTAKYFYLSVFSSALFLYGLSFLYGVAGTTWLQAPSDTRSLRAALDVATGPWSMLGLGFVIAGLGFKIAAVPFHFYAPDVYQGTSNANAALLSVAPKIAGFAAITRLIVMVLGPGSDVAWQLMLVLAVVTMTLGNVCALWQQNIRRMMAYSSIAHAGYMLIGVAVASIPHPLALTLGGTAAMLFYLWAYALGALGFFAALASLGHEDQHVEFVDQLAGLSSRRPLTAAIAAVCLFSLAGIPPLIGFWGKLTLFSSALGVGLRQELGEASYWFLALAVIGALNAAIAAAYYLRLIAAMYFRSAPDRSDSRSSELPSESPSGSPSGSHHASPSTPPGSTRTTLRPSAPQWAAAICAFLLLAMGVYQAPLADAVGRAEQGLRVTPAGEVDQVAQVE
jgi:NADH-quinone oxidoreductase subunit N